MKHARITIALTLAFFGGCDRKAATPLRAPDAAPLVVEAVSAPTAVADVGQSARASPWKVEGKLVGVADSRAIVAANGIVSIDVMTGEEMAKAATAAEDSQPSFLNHLPRLDRKDAPLIAVDRLEELPIYLGDGVVVFMRGTEDAVTSMVGLDATTLEEAWVKPLAYKPPIRTCATRGGIVIVAATGEPARAIDWKGGQRWLRELSPPDQELRDFRCTESQVHVEVDAEGSIVAYDGETGDLVPTAVVAPPGSISEAGRPAVRQVGDSVVSSGTF